MNPWLGLLAGLLIVAAMGFGAWLGIAMMRRAGWNLEARGSTREKALRAILALAAVWTGMWIAGGRFDEPLFWCVPIFAAGIVLVLIFFGFKRA
ncbi:hypothetical protein ACQKOH_03270 [Sphingomonas sp. NPDC092331]|uniref:hypothetical protein n=1 Tax=unclassified Sphingomonas TaxID=196159 RepID=UPI0031F56914